MAPEAQALHAAQEELTRRLIGVRDGAPAERNIIADIGTLSDALLRHRLRQNAAASVAAVPTEEPTGTAFA